MKNQPTPHYAALLACSIAITSLLSCSKDELLSPDDLTDNIEDSKPPFFLGQEYGGGIIFYLDETGKHGLVAAREDLGPAPWGCRGVLIAQSNDDQQMTRNIVTACDETHTAARLCEEYKSYEKEGKDGRIYDDWFMPGTDAFAQLYDVVPLACPGRSYWTTNQTSCGATSEIDPAIHVTVIGIGCRDGAINAAFVIPTDKSMLRYVRPVRKF